MRHNFHSKKKKRIFFPSILVLVLVFVLGVMYFKKTDTYILNSPLVVATTTTKIPEPKTKPSPKTIGEMEIYITPSRVEQGDPAIITVLGLASTTSVKSFTFDNRPLIYFVYEGQVTAFLGVDLNSKVGAFPVVLTLNDGKQVSKDFVVEARPVLKKLFDIPEKLGGNSPESIKMLFTTLAQEGKIINAIPTGYKILWTEKFKSPLEGTLVIDDPYGYTRIIGNSTMPHKGVDLHASIGTPVYAMNRGLVGFTDSLRNYGNVVVIDHGYGLQTVYMHLSEINVTKGQMIEKGELLGKSGDTGYTLNPHLHLTVRIWDVSIDPMKFLELFGQ